jgi:hypothetical protein
MKERLTPDMQKVLDEVAKSTISFDSVLFERAKALTGEERRRISTLIEGLDSSAGAEMYRRYSEFKDVNYFLKRLGITPEMEKREAHERIVCLAYLSLHSDFTSDQTY